MSKAILNHEINFDLPVPFTTQGVVVDFGSLALDDG